MGAFPFYPSNILKNISLFFLSMILNTLGYCIHMEGFLCESHSGVMGTFIKGYRFKLRGIFILP